MVKAMKSAARPKAAVKQVATPKKRNPSSKCLISMIEEQDVKETSKAKRPRSEESAFQKLLQDNFYNHGFTENEITMIVKDGVCCTSEIQRDRERWMSKEITMGKGYYEAKRIKWRDPESAYAKLVPADADEELDEVLYEALVMLHENRKNDHHFFNWAADVNELGQASLVVVEKTYGCDVFVIYYAICKIDYIRVAFNNFL